MSSHKGPRRIRVNWACLLSADRLRQPPNSFVACKAGHISSWYCGIWEQSPGYRARSCLAVGSDPRSLSLTGCKVWAHHDDRVIPSMRTPGAEVVRGRWRWSVIGRSLMEPFAVGGVAVLAHCTASGPAGGAIALSVRFSGRALPELARIVRASCAVACR